MSRNFRPVVETWGSHSSCFVDSDKLEQILEDLASEDFSGAGKTEGQDYGEVRSFWIEDGIKFLDFVDKYSAAELIAMNSDWEDSDTENIKSVFSNMKNDVAMMRSMLKDGSLTFYIDQY